MKIRWRVEAAPTGRYKSFFKRGWPVAYYAGDRPAAAIYCEDSYRPADARSGQHGELTVRIADHSVGENRFAWRTLKKRCSTLVEAKNLVDAALKTHPHFIPKEKP